MKEPQQQCKYAKPVKSIENVGRDIKYNECKYSSQNEDIYKLHFLSHIFSETENIQKFLSTLKKPYIVIIGTI